MAVTIKQTEAIPASYPNVVPRWVVAQGDEDNVPDPDQVWQRIESYVAHRWTERAVVWIVEGEGEWTPPLVPATVTATEVWENQAWTSATLYPSPLGGYEVPGDGPYRITATVGGGTVPAAVEEAYRRLHEYSRGIVDSFKNEPAFGGGEEGVAYSWTAKALQLSGAADLLRPYRRA